MSHKKLRDWPVMNFSYWIKPEGETPQVVWDEAKKMNNLWNCFVEENKKLQEEYRALYDDFPVIKTLKDELEEAKSKYNEAYNLLQEMKKKHRTKNAPVLTSYKDNVKNLLNNKKELSGKLKEAKEDIRKSDEWKKKDELKAELRDKESKIFKTLYRRFRDEGVHYGNINEVNDRFRNAKSRGVKNWRLP
jgi:DNA repair exonuclease SbcCD ATPase subunit